MNSQPCFGDTLDNITFPNSTRNKSFNFNEDSLQNVFASEDFKHSFNNTVKPSSSQTNISVDDSIFLKEFESSQVFNCAGSINLSNEPTFRSTTQPDLSLRLTPSQEVFNRTSSVKEESLNERQIPTSQSVTQHDLFLRRTQNREVKENQRILNESGGTEPDEIVKTVQHNSLENAQYSKTVQRGKDYGSISLDYKKLDLSSWGLPKEILEKYKQRNITKMFAWQEQCLSNEDLFKNNCNLIYSAPTSAGKTLVAEMMAIKTVIDRRKKVLFVLPFVSVVREKMFYLQDILGTSGIRVEGFMGSYSSPGGFQAVQVAVCTIEKANSLLNRLLEEGNLEDIGTVIIDEMHLLGDANRGYLLELLLTKLLYMSGSSENLCIQIIGMSATLPNLNLLGKWLKAEVYTTDFRPIPLYEQWMLENTVYNKNLQEERTIQLLPELKTDTDNILYLCLETIQNSCSVLIFCPTKNWCENLSEQIALAFWQLGCSDSPLGLTLRKELNTELIKELLEQLKQCPSGLDKILRKTISFGVAFHHAGLTMDERDIIEAAFRKTTLRVLVATSTLSSGVNLPARRVIIRTPLFHGKSLDSLVYRQMIGRAGRMGRDTSGESILICQKNNYEVAKELVSSDLKPIRSCLNVSGILTRAILEVVASGVVTTPDDVTRFSSCTLFAAEDDEPLSNPVTEAIHFLCTNEFIRLQELVDGTSKYLPTPLGKACLSSSMSPEEGLSIFIELQKARQCFVLETELHLIYIVTPYSTCNQWGNLDWMLFLEMWEKLPASMKRVGELVGVRESYIISATRNKINTVTTKLYRKLQIHKRFFTALALQDLVNEVPINEVAIKYGCSRGMLQSLQQSSSTFAGMLTIFSRQLGWSSIEILISQFQDRLQFGISRDLLDLMKLPLLNGPRARTLYNVGIETLAQLASADVIFIENALHKVGPFESKKGIDGESEYDVERRNKMKTVWVTGKEGLTAKEAAVLLVQEARRYLQLELGLVDAKWDQQDKTETDTLDEAVIEEKHVLSSNLEPPRVKLHDEKILIDQSLKTSIPIVNIEKSDSSIETYDNNVNTNNALETSKCKININQSYELETSNQSLKINQSDNALENSSQSLFDGSFEQCIAVDFTKKCLNKDTSKQRSSDSGLEFDNGSFLENAFLSCDKDEQPSVMNVSNTQPSNDFIDSSQSVCNSVITLKNISSTNSPRRSCGMSFKKHKSIVDECTPAKRRKTVCKKSNNDELKTIDIIDVCKNGELFNTFCEEVKSQAMIAVSFACKQCSVSKSVIGNCIVDENSINDSFEDQQFLYKDVIVEGVAFSWGNNISYYISLKNETVITNDKKVTVLKQLFCKSALTIHLFDCKEQIKVAKRCCGIDFNAIAEDSKLGDWLLDPDGKEKNLQAMALKYVPKATNLLQLVGPCKGIGSIGLNICNTVDPKIRSSVESVVSWHLSHSINKALQQENIKLYSTYKIEMKSLLCITRMELIGIKVNIAQLHHLVDTLKKECENLQNQAFSHAGRRFSFTSSNDVAKILGLYKGKRCSTNKQTLQRQSSPIANLILQWRKLNCTLTKMIYPLLRLVENDRIYGYCITHTSTGRISMHEPNMQNVPRDFDVDIPRLSLKNTISCRSVFVASENCSFLSADYCQLELRILAEFCGDPTLCTIMKTNNDVFKLIAAHWKQVEIDQIDEALRQWTKQLCYGIIYGMGSKALAEHLSVTEEEAREFMESFKKQYSSIQIYIQKTINKCKGLGYVETFAGRRRYLPNINNDNPTLKGQAERQAVNTTIQGSAADIAKFAMTLIENRFHSKYRHPKNLPKLVLHLHDEFLYEVHDKYLLKTAKILKQAMEESVKLSIPFPVKLKSGKSWGAMQELII